MEDGGGPLNTVPLNTGSTVVCLSSGFVGSTSMRVDLLTAKEKEKTALSSFTQDQLITRTSDLFTHFRN